MRPLDPMMRAMVSSMAKSDDMQLVCNELHTKTETVQKAATEITDKVQHIGTKVDNTGGRRGTSRNGEPR